MVTLMDDDDFDPSDDPTYRAGVLMGRNQALADVMERLPSVDTMPPGKTVRALRAWTQQSMDEVRVELEYLIADLDAGVEADGG